MINVVAKVDSHNYGRFKVTLSPQQVAKRRCETFRRISSLKLCEWVKKRAETMNDESVFDWLKVSNGEKFCDHNSTLNGIAPSVAGSATISVINAFSTETSLGLLVDLRSFEEYKKCRISNSINFPGIMFSRDIFPPQLIAMKRKQMGRPLILYHENDKTSSMYATILTEKGWEEVWVVNGGFNEFKLLYPEMTVGN